MAAKLVVFGLLLAIVLSVAIIAWFRYLDKRDERGHEKEMLRERRDAEMLTGDEDWIDRELDREE